jgi:hypothetical protein
MILFQMEGILLAGFTSFRLGVLTCGVSHNIKKQKVKDILVKMHVTAYKLYVTGLMHLHVTNVVYTGYLLKTMSVPSVSSEQSMMYL